MEITVYSKPGCKICDSAKAHIQSMGFSYQEKELSTYLTIHDGWEKDESVGLMAACAYHGNPFHQLPTICIDGDYFNYPTAMKFLKSVVKEKWKKNKMRNGRVHQQTVVMSICIGVAITTLILLMMIIQKEIPNNIPQEPILNPKYQWEVEMQERKIRAIERLSESDKGTSAYLKYLKSE